MVTKKELTNSERDMQSWQKDAPHQPWPKYSNRVYLVSSTQQPNKKC